MQAYTSTVVAREAPLGGVRLVFCERLYQLVDLGLLFSAVAPERHPIVPALNAGRCLHLVRDGLRFITAFASLASELPLATVTLF